MIYTITYVDAAMYEKFPNIALASQVIQDIPPAVPREGDLVQIEEGTLRFRGMVVSVEWVVHNVAVEVFVKLAGS